MDLWASLLSELTEVESGVSIYITKQQQQNPHKVFINPRWWEAEHNEAQDLNTATTALQIHLIMILLGNT